MKEYIIDASGYQGEIDFERVRAAGVQGVLLKCSEGESYLAPKFLPNYHKARAAGMKVGAYHFLRAATVEEGTREGAWFGQCIEGLTLELGAALDIEHEGVNWDGAGVSAGQAARIVEQFERGLLRHHWEQPEDEPMLLYASIDYMRRFLRDKTLSRYPRWLANPSHLPYAEPVKQVQYSWTGQVDGIERPVDLNVRYGQPRRVEMAQLGEAPTVFPYEQPPHPQGWRITGTIGRRQVDLLVRRTAAPNTARRPVRAVRAVPKQEGDAAQGPSLP